MTMAVANRVGALVLCLFVPKDTIAYLCPLSDESVREAYFFGRSTDRARVTEFLGQYMRNFQTRNGGPNVYGIELRTPYEGVVLRSSENQTAGYSAQRAQIDYNANRDLEVRVTLLVGVSGPESANLYSDRQGRILDRREEFWRAFRFRVLQDKLIEPKKVEGAPVYSRRRQGLAGAEVRLDFDPADFSPCKTRIEVVGPGGQTVVAEFPLDQLR
jgi:hypothetical protein